MDPFSYFMSFSHHLRTLKNGKTYSKRLYPKKTVTDKNTTHTYAPRDPERIEEPNNGIPQELIEERISANLGLLNKQLPTFTNY